MVEAEQTRAAAEGVEAHTESTVSAMDNLKRLLDESAAANSSRHRERAASDPDEPHKLPVKLSSRAASSTKGEIEEQPKSGRMDTKKKIGNFFSSLRLGKHKADTEQHSEQEPEHKDEDEQPTSQSSTSASTPATSSSSSSSGLDYKTRMQQLIERRGTGDRRHSSPNTSHGLSSPQRASMSSLSQSSSSEALKSSSAEVSDTMNENNAIAARNVSLLQQMESRAAEMEDQADGMLAMARKIKEEQKKKSIFGW